MINYSASKVTGTVALSHAGADSQMAGALTIVDPAHGMWVAAHEGRVAASSVIDAWIEGRLSYADVVRTLRHAA